MSPTLSVPSLSCSDHKASPPAPCVYIHLTSSPLSGYLPSLSADGNNFGESIDDAGTIQIYIGNTTCDAVEVGDITANIWQETTSGTPYLWCETGSSTVGSKSVRVFVAGQNATMSAAESGVSAVCSSDYYGPGKLGANFVRGNSFFMLAFQL